jgi:transcriptional regulator with XRE-family HTH domain
MSGQQPKTRRSLSNPAVLCPHRRGAVAGAACRVTFCPHAAPAQASQALTKHLGPVGKTSILYEALDCFQSLHTYMKEGMTHLAALLKRARGAKGWSQKHLADTIGVTPGFVAKLEAGHAFPSYERCLALANALGLSLDDLLSRVEEARLEASQQRLRTRGSAMRGPVRIRGQLEESAEGGPAPETSATELAQELVTDAALQAAYRNLKRALADPQMRPTVLAVLEVFARAAQPQ